MSKLDKFKSIFDAAAAIAKPFVPGAAGTALDAVTTALNGHPQEPSKPSADAIKQLAADNDEQTAAILALHERVKRLEER